MNTSSAAFFLLFFGKFCRLEEGRIKIAGVLPESNQIQTLLRLVTTPCVTQSRQNSLI